MSKTAPFVEVTVVRTQSPTSVRAGDVAVVRPDGSIEGSVGGTCAEASVRLYALRAMESGDPVLLRIMPGGAEGQPAVVEGTVTVNNPCLSGGVLEIFLKPHLPAPTLRVAGKTPIAAALADLGRRMGYAVETSAAEEAEPAPDDAAVVVASHGRDEERVLSAALRSGVPYVALVASHVRGDAVRGSLDLTAEQLTQLHSPAGLEIGAETPEEIAVAILAEIVALRQGHRPEASVQSPAATAVPVVISTEAAVDPVCGMEVAVSEASIQLERAGELYYFCSEGCRDTFSAEGVPDGAAH